MYTEYDISIYDFVCAISEAIDLISPELNNHHVRVAYIAYAVAREMDLPNSEIQDIILAARLHDIGAFSNDERVNISKWDAAANTLDQHALVGYKLLKGFVPLAKAAELIKYHHVDYDIAMIDDIPIGSHILNFADRLAVLINNRSEILGQVPELINKIFQRKDSFHPDTIKAFNQLLSLEYFWVEVVSPVFSSIRLDRIQFSREIIDMDALRDFAQVFAHIIDFRSRFTATHSSGVAAVASEIAIIAGFSERESKQMEVAGFLHDLGKLAVPNEILEKNGPLSDDELFVVRKHTFYTYVILSKIRDLDNIALWAACHHEKQNGNGYPFHVRGDNFSMMARIMAVADIATALTEDRPYRKGMTQDRAVKVLVNMVENGDIDPYIVGLVVDNFYRINNVRSNAQSEAQNVYDTFNNVDNLCKKEYCEADFCDLLYA